MSLVKLKQDLKNQADPKRSKVSAWFFKTGPGQYGEGDKFLGLSVPQQRKIAKKYNNLPFSDIEWLLNSAIHEHRLVSLLILVDQFSKGDNNKKKKIYNFYLKNSHKINNWDLVDLSAHKIVGQYLLDKPKNDLYKLARSKNLWSKRISIVATWQFIRQEKFTDTIKISKILLNDSHDLIHKAVGWMLREVGKKDKAVLIKFLDQHYKKMPRTMLRYSIEKLSDIERKDYLKK